MNVQIKGLTLIALIAVTTMLCGGPAFAADAAGSDVVPLATDLTAVIALQGIFPSPN